MKKIFAILAISAMFAACGTNETVVIDDPEMQDTIISNDTVPAVVADTTEEDDTIAVME